MYRVKERLGLYKLTFKKQFSLPASIYLYFLLLAQSLQSRQNMFCLYLLWIRLAGVWRVTGASRDRPRGWWQLTFHRNHFSFCSAVSTACRSAWGEVCDASSSGRSLRCRPRNCNLIPENSTAWDTKSPGCFSLKSLVIFFPSSDMRCFDFWHECIMNWAGGFVYGVRWELPWSRTVWAYPPLNFYREWLKYIFFPWILMAPFMIHKSMQHFDTKICIA